MTEDVVVAMRERIERHRARPNRAATLARLAEELGVYPVLDDRSPDEILGWDDAGLPA